MDDYGNCMLTQSAGWDVQTDNALLRWFIDGCEPESFTESIMLMAGAI